MLMSKSVIAVMKDKGTTCVYIGMCIATDEGHCRVAETFGLKTFLDAGARV